MKKFLLLLLLVLLFVSLNSSFVKDNKIKIAVLKFENLSKWKEKDFTTKIATQLADKLLSTGKFITTDWKTIIKAYQEKNKELPEKLLVSNACEIGKFIGYDYVTIGTVKFLGKVGSSVKVGNIASVKEEEYKCVIQLKVIDVNSKKIVLNREVEGEIEAEFSEVKVSTEDTYAKTTEKGKDYEPHLTKRIVNKLIDRALTSLSNSVEYHFFKTKSFKEPKYDEDEDEDDEDFDDDSNETNVDVQVF